MKLTEHYFIKNYRIMWPFVKPYWFRALLAALMTIPIGAFDGAIAWFLKPVIDNALIAREQGFSALIPFLIVGFTIIQGLLTYAADYLNIWVGGKITLDIKRTLYDKLLSMDSSYFDLSSSGMIQIRYHNDADLAAQGLITNLKKFLTKFFSSIALVFVLFYNSWQLAIVAVVVMALMVPPLKIVRKKIKAAMNRSLGEIAAAITHLNETFHGNKIIASFTLEEYMRRRFKKYLDGVFRLFMNLALASNWLSPSLHIISSVGIALVIGFGSHFIVNGTITPGNFVSFVAAMLLLYTPLKTVGRDYVAIQTSFFAIERMNQIFNFQPYMKSHDGTETLTGIQQDLEFNNVRFGYKPQTEVLHGINFKIKVGQMVALVGNSGGGKTTISSLIPRLYEVSGGEIRIDGINIKNYTLQSLRGNIAIVFQDNFLFLGTIRENIVLGNQNISDETIWQALKNACLDEFINSLENKLETVVGERGISLSGGQKQRVAIARAFVRNAPLVILDEATSSLDNKAELVVQQALENLMQNRTVIVIAHRLSTVQNADNILVIQNGEIVEQGSHAELIGSRGAYYELYATQFSNG